MMRPAYIVLILIGVLVLAFLLRRPGRMHAKYRSAAEKLHKRFLSGELSGAQGIGYLRKIDPYVFEELVLDGFQANGYRVIRNNRYSGDGGIDGRVQYNGKTYLIQCKRYKSYIQISHVEEFGRLCEEAGLYGFFVHTGKTGAGSWEGKSRRIRFVSGERLLSLLSGKDNPEAPIGTVRKDSNQNQS